MNKFSMFCLSVVVSSALYATDIYKVDDKYASGIKDGYKLTDEMLSDLASGMGWFRPIDLSSTGYISYTSQYSSSILPNFKNPFVGGSDKYGAYGKNGDDILYFPNVISSVPQFIFKGISNVDKELGNQRVLPIAQSRQNSQYFYMDGNEWRVGKTWYNDQIAVGYNDQRANHKYYITDAYEYDEDSKTLKKANSSTNKPLLLKTNKFITEFQIDNMQVPMFKGSNLLEIPENLDKQEDWKFYRVGFTKDHGLSIAMPKSTTKNENGELVIGDVYQRADGKIAVKNRYDTPFGYSTNVDGKFDETAASSILIAQNGSKYGIIGILSSKDSTANEEVYFSSSELSSLINNMKNTAIKIGNSYDIKKISSGKYNFVDDKGNSKGEFLKDQDIAFDVGFYGKKHFMLLDDLDQGNGGMYAIDDGTSLEEGQVILESTQKSDGSWTTYTGAGIKNTRDFGDSGIRVLWGLASGKTADGDFDSLHKIGNADMYVANPDLYDGKSGFDRGYLSIGDSGTVYLFHLDDDHSNNEQFQSIELVGGYSRLSPSRVSDIKSDDGVINTGLEFGYRGGWLELTDLVKNGDKTITFDHIRAADYGARIINESSDAITLNLIPNLTSKANTDEKTKDIYSQNIVFHGAIGKNINLNISGEKGFKGTYLFDGRIGENTYKSNTDIDINGANVALQGMFFPHATKNKNEDPTKADQLDVFEKDFYINNIKVKSGSSFSVLRDAYVLNPADDDKLTKISVEGNGNTLNFGDMGGIFVDKKQEKDGINQQVEKIEGAKTPTFSIFNTKTSAISGAFDKDGNKIYINENLDHFAKFLGDIDATNATNTNITMARSYVSSAIKGDDTSKLTMGGGALWYVRDNSNLGDLVTKNLYKGRDITNDALIDSSNMIVFGDNLTSSYNKAGTTLTVKNFEANNLYMVMNINAKDQQKTDKLKITDKATSGEVKDGTNYVYLVSDGSTIKDGNEVVFIEAPTGTRKNLFTIPTLESEKSPFHDYKLKGYVHEGVDDGKNTQWYLSTEKEEPVKPEEPTPPTDNSDNDNPSDGETTTPPTDDKPVVTPPVVDDTDDKPSTGDDNNKPNDDNKDEIVTPDKNPLYKPVIDSRFVNRIRGLMGVSESIFMHEDELLMKRLGDIRSANFNGGFWIKENLEHDEIMDANLKFNKVDFGFDTKVDDSFYGFMGTFGNGHADVENGKNDFKYFSVGAYYTYAPVSGFFVDVVGKYIYSNQKATLPSKDTFAPFNKEYNNDVSMFLGSVQSGYRFLSDSNFFIEPSAKITAGYIQGYDIKGNNSKIEVKNSKPVFYKVGFQTGKNYELGSTAMSSSIGLHYEDKMDRNEGKIYLKDSAGSISYKTFESGRFITNISTDAHFSDNLTIYGRAETSFDGDFKTKFGGQIGIRYNF